jgi:OOP family OmpA-OmpF porin
MNPNPPLRLAALALAAPLGLALVPPAAAQDDSYYYFGLGAGQGRAKFDEESLAARALSPGINATVLERDERDRAYRAFFGWQWNRYLGAEAGYFDLGRTGFNASTLTPGEVDIAGRLDGTMRVRGYNLDLVATLPLGDTVSLLGRVGVAFARTRNSFVGSGGAEVAQPAPVDRQSNPKTGLGIQVAFTPSVLMRAEVERYRVSDAMGQRAHINTTMVSLVFPFGRAPSPMRRAEPMPAYVPTVAAAAPPPPVVMAPAPVIAPMPVEPERVAPRALPPPTRVVLPVDSMFSHDSRELRPEARTALDGFASRLAGRRYDSILVSGHADRMGEVDHNQQLSQQRADVVKAYLSGLSGIDAGRIRSIGKGSAEPLTSASDCGTPIAREALILCLQGDRRVEVEVSGEL